MVFGWLRPIHQWSYSSCHSFVAVSGDDSHPVRPAESQQSLVVEHSVHSVHIVYFVLRAVWPVVHTVAVAGNESVDLAHIAVAVFGAVVDCMSCTSCTSLAGYSTGNKFLGRAADKLVDFGDSRSFERHFEYEDFVVAAADFVVAAADFVYSIGFDYK